MGRLHIYWSEHGQRGQVLVVRLTGPKLGWWGVRCEYDYIVIGSGFGGSVSAMRLAQKGYSVLVLEAGKRYRSQDFPETNLNLRKSIWMPAAKLFGILRITVLRHAMILSGAGVGGGSLVYGNTLLVPPDAAWEDAAWRELADWKNELAPHYETAQRMLGVVESPELRAADLELKQSAEELGVADSFRPTRVGVYFGDGDTEAPPIDPFFDGEGPPRRACTKCGGCMVGCRHEAKNTLDKNYLYFAERLGAEVLPERMVTAILEAPGGGYELRTECSTAWLGKDYRSFYARGIVVSAGALGTNKLLLRCKDQGYLPRLSPRVGDRVRTNSEAIIAVTGPSSARFCDGIAITSSINLKDGTHVEVVTYGEGSDALANLSTLMVDGGGKIPRWLRFLLAGARHPLQLLKSLNPFGWARRSIILLCMQTEENELELRLRNDQLRSRLPKGMRAVPTFIPAAHELARNLAARIRGVANSSIFEVLADTPTTAHILGGVSMGTSAKEGVIDSEHRVFGYENLLVVDGSTIGANLGVNPSLTITTLAERAMTFVPPKPGQKEPDWSQRVLYAGPRRSD